MSSPVVWRYVRKDLHFSRAFIIGTLAIAVVALPLTALGPVGMYAAMILMICAGAAPATFICMYLIVAERKERANLFSLSLPISPTQVALAKIGAAAAAYLLPWALLAVGAVALFSVAHVQFGLLPFGTMFWLFMLDEFFLMLAVTVSSGSEGLTTGTIVFCNVSISFYIFIFLHAPSIARDVGGAVAVWNRFVVEVIAAEFGIAVLLVLLMLWNLSRKKDFV
jgi:ABC-type transport system involved in multi-copper enzyme maturation permease subunit